MSEKYLYCPLAKDYCKFAPPSELCEACDDCLEDADNE